MKQVVEEALQAEPNHHLDVDNATLNIYSRNGFMGKTLKVNFGELPIPTPRDRAGAFEPTLMRKGQTRFTAFDDQILSLYARSMSTRDIASMFQEMYGAEVSHTLITKVTEAVLEDVHAWQSRTLDEVYPIVYLDCIVVKVNQDKRIINKAIYLALGVNLDGKKESLGLWISENEGAKFWLNVLTALQNRGVADIFIASVDGLTGFSDAIAAAYPNTKIQLCIVHMVRNSLRYVASKHMKEVAADLKTIDQAAKSEGAERALEIFAQKWVSAYASIAKSWCNHWPNLITLFDYPSEIRKVIKNRKIFPNDNAAFKVVYLTMLQASKKWTMPLRDWKAALIRFSIELGDRVPPFN